MSETCPETCTMRQLLSERESAATIENFVCRVAGVEPEAIAEISTRNACSGRVLNGVKLHTDEGVQSLDPMTVAKVSADLRQENTVINMLKRKVDACFGPLEIVENGETSTICGATNVSKDVA